MISIVHKLNNIYNITHNNNTIILNTGYSFICFLAFLNKKIIDYDDFHILFHSISCLNLQIYNYHRFLIVKIFINETNYYNNSNDLIHLGLSHKSKFIGQLYNVGSITFKNRIIKYNIYEFIDHMFNNDFIDKLNFIDFYGIIIDYIKALDTIHNSGFIHSNIKPIQLMVNKLKIGKLIGFDDIISIENDRFNYHNTSGSIDFLAYERLSYFIENGFIGNTSISSDLWELYYSILVACNITNNKEELEDLYKNGGLVYFLIDKLSKRFKLLYSDSQFALLKKIAKIFEIGLNLNPIHRKNTNYHLNILLNNTVI
jgi:serine/threonine protein kinase